LHFSMTVHGTSSAGPSDFDILSATLSSILFLKPPLVCISQPLSLLNLSRIQIHNSLFELLQLLIHAWNLEELRWNLNPEPLSEIQVVFELLDPPFLLLKLPLKLLQSGPELGYLIPPHNLLSDELLEVLRQFPRGC